MAPRDDLTVIRPGGPDDLPFLGHMLYEAVVWGPGSRRPPMEEVLGHARIARYIEGWGRPGDSAVVATDARSRPVGAAWYRLFPAESPGYGFIGPTVPELTLAVVSQHRGRGIGGALLDALLEQAAERGLPTVSLSVEPDNPARSLYESRGFLRVQADEGSWLMRADLDDCIRVVDYDDSWPRRFAWERRRIGAALADVVVGVEHVGSTSVPGLAAKPVIDILVRVTSLGDRAAYTEPLERIGYVARPDPSPERRFFRNGGVPRRTQLHAVGAASEEERRHLALRDYLRANPTAAAEYASLKSTLAARFPHDRLAYLEAKAPLIQALEERMRMEGFVG